MYQTFSVLTLSPLHRRLTHTFTHKTSRWVTILSMSTVHRIGYTIDWKTEVYAISLARSMAGKCSRQVCQTSACHKSCVIEKWRIRFPPPPTPTFRATAQRVPWRPRFWGFYITHNNAQQSVGLLCTSNQFVPSQRPLPDNSQQSQQTSMPPAGFEPKISAGERPQT